MFFLFSVFFKAVRSHHSLALIWAFPAPLLLLKKKKIKANVLHNTVMLMISNCSKKLDVDLL